MTGFEYIGRRDLHPFWDGSRDPNREDVAEAYEQGKADGYHEGYDAGATWADEHPRWTSVEDYATDELPPLIDEKDPNGESVHVLFVIELDGIQFISKGCFDYDSGMWHALETDCSYCKENVTHWMPLPAPPKKGGEQ